MESLEGFPCNRFDGYFSEHFMNSVNIDNGSFVSRLSKKQQARNGEYRFFHQQVI
jgi:hypothetical protein